jgi:hypothetical protein
VLAEFRCVPNRRLPVEGLLSGVYKEEPLLKPFWFAAFPEVSEFPNFSSKGHKSHFVPEIRHSWFLKLRLEELGSNKEIVRSSQSTRGTRLRSCAAGRDAVANSTKQSPTARSGAWCAARTTTHPSWTTWSQGSKISSPRLWRPPSMGASAVGVRARQMRRRSSHPPPRPRALPSPSSPSTRPPRRSTGWASTR